MSSPPGRLPLQQREGKHVSRTALPHLASRRRAGGRIHPGAHRRRPVGHGRSAHHRARPTTAPSPSPARGSKGELTDGLMDAGGFTDFGLTLDTGFALDQAGDKSGVATVNRAFQPVINDYISGDAFGDAGSTYAGVGRQGRDLRPGRRRQPHVVRRGQPGHPPRGARQRDRPDRGSHRGQVDLRRLRQHPGPVVRRPRPHRGQVAARRRRRRLPARPAVHVRLLPPGLHQGQDRRRPGLRRGPGRLRAERRRHRDWRSSTSSRATPRVPASTAAVDNATDWLVSPAEAERLLRRQHQQHRSRRLGPRPGQGPRRPPPRPRPGSASSSRSTRQPLPQRAHQGHRRDRLRGQGRQGRPQQRPHRRRRARPVASRHRPGDGRPAVGARPRPTTWASR